MGIQLIAMDLDGTLLQDDKTISLRTLATLRAARAKGVHITVATGRMYVAAAYFAQQIGADVPVVCCNGGLVRSATAAESLFEARFPQEMARAVLAACYQNDWYAQWYIGDQIYAKDFRPEMFLSYKTVKNFRLNEIGDDYAPYTDDVIQIVIRDDGGKIGAIERALRAQFGSGIDMQQNTQVSVDITPPGIHKAVGLAALVRHLGLRPEEVLACGDADNDLTMLRYAGISVATANAIPAAREIADFVTDDCNHDGVAKAIEKFVLQG